MFAKNAYSLLILLNSYLKKYDIQPCFTSFVNVSHAGKVRDKITHSVWEVDS